MSGQGNPPGRAPVRALTVFGDQPIGSAADGSPIRPTMYFVQFLQRLVSYVGQPNTNTPAGMTISEQVGDLNAEVESLVTRGSIGTASVTSRLYAVEQAIARLFGRQRPTDIVVLHNGARLLDGFGSPEGVVPGNLGDSYQQRDGGTGTSQWTKETGSPGSSTGWVPTGAGTPQVIYAPLVNGDLPGPTPIATADGQFIMVPIT